MDYLMDYLPYVATATLGSLIVGFVIWLLLPGLEDTLVRRLVREELLCEESKRARHDIATCPSCKLVSSPSFIALAYMLPRLRRLAVEPVIEGETEQGRILRTVRQVARERPLTQDQSVKLYDLALRAHRQIGLHLEDKLQEAKKSP